MQESQPTQRREEMQAIHWTLKNPNGMSDLASGEVRRIMQLMRGCDEFVRMQSVESSLRTFGTG